MAITGISKSEHSRLAAKISAGYPDEPELLELLGELNRIYDSYERSLVQIRDVVESYDELKDKIRKAEHLIKRLGKLMAAVVLLLCLFGLVQVKAQVTGPGNDGSYVFYQDGKAVFRTLTTSGVVADSLVKSVSVAFTEHPGWNFSVDLKGSLTVPPVEYAQPERIFFISDVEGEFEGFRALLIAGGVMDSAYNWTFGKGHVVVCGDLFDRGSNVPECMWLMYKLEQSALVAGGYWHTILGNHDVMNLSGDVRYVQPKYFESAKRLGVDYMRLYAADTELGRWLRTKNTIEKIGDNLCMHAGIAPQINALAMPLDSINLKCRPYYDKARLMRGVGDVSVDAFFSGETSLFWYRGYFAEPKATEAEVSESLRLYGVKRIVVGHTIVPGNVGFYYGAKVLGLDVNQHGGDHQAALFEGGKWFKLNEKGLRTEL